MEDLAKPLAAAVFGGQRKGFCTVKWLQRTGIADFIFGARGVAKSQTALVMKALQSGSRSLGGQSPYKILHDNRLQRFLRKKGGSRQASRNMRRYLCSFWV